MPADSNQFKTEMRAFFRGKVQGVGFRATTVHYARRLGLKGLVKNCDDGSVEVLAQGTRENLDALVSELNKAMSSYIASSDVSFHEIARPFASFDIAFE